MSYERIKKMYPDAKIYIIKQKYNSNKLVVDFQTAIQRYKKIYKEDIFNKLNNNYKIRLIYSPIAYVKIRCHSFSYTYDQKQTITRTYREYETEVDHYGDEVSQSNRVYTGNTRNETETTTKPVEMTQNCDFTYWSTSDSFSTNTDLVNVLCDWYSPKVHKGIFSRYEIDFEKAEENAIAGLENHISDNIDSGAYNIRCLETTVVEKVIYMLPLYELVTFDGNNRFYMNAFTGKTYNVDYEEQTAYVKTEVKLNRGKRYWQATDEISKTFNKSLWLFIPGLLLTAVMLAIMYIEISKGSFNIFNLIYSNKQESLDKWTIILSYVIPTALSIWLIVLLFKLIFLKDKMLACAAPILKVRTPNEYTVIAFHNQAKDLCTNRKISLIVLFILTVILLALFIVGNINFK